MEGLEGANALAKQQYCMEFMETLEASSRSGHGDSTCLASRVSVREGCKRQRQHNKEIGARRKQWKNTK